MSSLMRLYGCIRDRVKLINVLNSTDMVPEVVGTIGMSSASMGMDQGMWN